MITFVRRVAPWRWVEEFLPHYCAKLSPSHFFCDTGYYLVAAFILLNCAAFLASLDCIATQRPWLLWILCALGVAYIVDALLANTSFAFLESHPRSLVRSALFAFLAFCNVTVAFAVFYVAAGNAFSERLNYLMALYFSIVTVTTHGDSKIKPTAWPAYVLISAQLVTGLYFLAVILTGIVSWATKRGGPNA